MLKSYLICQIGYTKLLLEQLSKPWLPPNRYQETLVDTVCKDLPWTYAQYSTVHAKLQGDTCWNTLFARKDHRNRRHDGKPKSNTRFVRTKNYNLRKMICWRYDALERQRFQPYNRNQEWDSDSSKVGFEYNGNQDWVPIPMTPRTRDYFFHQELILIFWLWFTISWLGTGTSGCKKEISYHSWNRLWRTWALG